MIIKCDKCFEEDTQGCAGDPDWEPVGKWQESKDVSSLPFERLNG